MSVPVGQARHAGAAVDAVAGGDAGSSCFSRLRVAARLVVGHEDGVLVGQDVLQPAVGAGDRAHLVAEPAEVEDDEAGDARRS